MKLRRAVVLVFWLAHAALPLLVSQRPRDPLACCREKGAHQCFLRKRGTEGGLAVRAQNKVCAAAAAKAIASQAAVLPAPVVVANRVTGTRLANRSSRFVPFLRPILSPSRAPPAA